MVLVVYSHTSCCARLHDFPGLAYRKTYLYVSTKLAFWSCQLPGYNKCQNQPSLVYTTEFAKEETKAIIVFHLVSWREHLKDISHHFCETEIWWQFCTRPFAISSVGSKSTVSLFSRFFVEQLWLFSCFKLSKTFPKAIIPNIYLSTMAWSGIFVI